MNLEKMKLDNGIIKLEVINKGGEMSSLIYEGHEVLYDGKGPYWAGKNPTLFPIISSPKSKEYTLEGITYPIKNHGLIRYLELKTIKDDGKEIILGYRADEETLRYYPLNFFYQISYHLENNKVFINYSIKNEGSKTMPFTFGIHPGFLIDKESVISFKEDKEATFVTNQKTKEKEIKKLGEYKYEEFLKDIEKYSTVILDPLNSKEVELINKEYSVKIDISNFKYLALWTPNSEANFMCIEPWLSIDYIQETDNPFKDEFELHYLKENEEFNISYTIEMNKR